MMHAPPRRHKPHQATRSARSIIGVALTAVLMLAGCASGELNSEDADPQPTGSSSAYLQSQADERWQFVQNKYPGAKRPEVDVVRHVDRTEWATVVAECLTEAGFVAWPEPNGLLATNPGGSGQDEAHAIANYVRFVQYPLEEKYTQPFSDEQLRALYLYQTTTLIKCLRDAGVEVAGTVPSNEVFKETRFTAKHWSPYPDMPTANLSSDQIYELELACPETPEYVYDMN